MNRRLLIQGALVLTALLALTGCTREETTSSLLLGGDVFLARAGEPLFEPTDEPWGDLLTIREAFKHSFFAVNLESPLGTLTGNNDQTDLSYNLCAPPNSVHVLSQARVDLVTMANNHAQDCVDSAVSTTQTLDEAGIFHAGGQGDVVQVTISGRPIAILALNDVTGSYELDFILQQVQQAAAEVDLVVVSIHWGAEYQAGPTQHQRELAASLVDAGADIVWGHHPHVLQPLEWMQSKTDGHDALVLYSLGNLLSDQWMLQDAQKTVLVKIDFNDEGISKITLIAMRMEISSGQLVLVHDEKDLLWWKNRLNFDEAGLGMVEMEIWRSTAP